ncbi:DUF6896 domain-containing protein [Allomuricauda sp. SCSIO 65647]|uniref:DUF6896 domain-containing protein n=1 Tax=Allomuricauda sp. SCSIO 65647 TaxID=2908843 RepID=UPI001F3A329C|nr:hypothetical protein [Muricauda sp. SCSIO 65647]UJH68620.1 hypothetical protein L0P89_05250 [Muricauda sp. SCSIO 65647]
MKDQSNIELLIKDYQSTANHVVGLFQRKYGVENLLEGWYSGIYYQTGELKQEGINFYAFHGIGIAVHFDTKMIDFDFAFFPELRWDGFDLWRLKGFVSSQPKKYPELIDEKKLESEFERLKQKGIIENPKLEFPTSLYFWKTDLIS